MTEYVAPHQQGEVLQGLESVAELITGLAQLQTETGIVFGRPIVLTDAVEGAPPRKEIVGFILPSEENKDKYLVLVNGDPVGIEVSSKTGLRDIKDSYGPSMVPLAFDRQEVQSKGGLRATLNGQANISVAYKTIGLSQLVEQSVIIARETIQRGLEERQGRTAALAPVGSLIVDFSPPRPRRWGARRGRPS